ncbi:MAG: AAA family ATPase [Aestuariivita sp.]|nr:AAA family ATPase [Aestuariivita sp.]MCY4202152.1 AAA family ATPase [Aestuariivita sp.]
MHSTALYALELRNFKCFREQRIKFGMLTVLSGLNGVGKSSVIQALLLLRQSFSESPTQERLQLSGDLVGLGTGQDVLFDLADEDKLTFILEFAGGRRDEYAFSYSRKVVDFHLNAKLVMSTGPKGKPLRTRVTTG